MRTDEVEIRRLLTSSTTALHASDVARAMYDAYAARDRAAIEKLIAEDFQFTSPLDNRLDRATYFARCWPNSENLESFQLVHVVPDADRVFVTYEARTSNGHRFRNSEIVTVREGQAVEVEVYFGWDLPHKAPEGGYIEGVD